MTRLGFQLAILTLLALSAAVFSASPAQTQVPNIKFKGKVLEPWALGTFRVNPNTEAIPFSVPQSQELVITDVVISNTGTGAASAGLSAEGGPFLLWVTIPAESTFSHSYASGIAFPQEANVRLHHVSGPSPIDFHLNGFLRKAK